MRRWPFDWMPVWESVCACGHHRVRVDGREVCVNVMCRESVKMPAAAVKEKEAE